MESGSEGGNIPFVIGHEHNLIRDGASFLMEDVMGARENDARGDCEGRSIVNVFGLIRFFV